MKQIKLLLTVILIFTLFTFNKCNKDPLPPTLPNETQMGAGTLGCKINVEIYTAQTIAACINYNVQYYKSDSALLIKTNHGCATALQISLKGVAILQDYNIFSPLFNAFYYYRTNTSCNQFDRTNSIQTGTVTITKLDLTNKIVSGRFIGTIKQTGCIDLNITEGRFDFPMDIFN